jgi:hypothetical protein
MNNGRRATFSRFLAILLCLSATSVGMLSACYAASSGQQAEQSTGTASVARHIGAIKAINGTQITLAQESGPDLNVAVQDTTRIVRIAPGEKDLKNATPIQLQDLQVGDRILVGGKPTGDNQLLTASSVVVMKHSDLEARHEQDLQDWQKRGVDGPAVTVDAAAGNITISSRGKNVVVHTSKNTVIRRYAPDSVKFDDAKTGTLAEIRPGDQVRARGDRSADGGELAAEELVSGSFRNVAGTINSVDASSSTVLVHDLLSRKNLTVRITKDSQLHQLPAEIAQRFAMRLKRTAAGGAAGTASGADSPANSRNAASPGGPGTAAAESGGARRSGGAPDVQQMLNHLPAISINDLHKGDAVIVLSTEGTAGVGTTITLLTGVEPILQAAPNASGASILTPWSLSAPSGDAGGP